MVITKDRCWKAPIAIGHLGYTFVYKLTHPLFYTHTKEYLPLQSSMLVSSRVDGMYRRLFPAKFNLVSSRSWPKCAGISVILWEIKSKYIERVTEHLIYGYFIKISANFLSNCMNCC